MGVGYIHPVVQFALSDYPNANLGGPGAGSLQPNADDIQTIDEFLREGNTTNDRRIDEPGTSTGNAGAVPAPGVSAYITSRTDVDYFALGNCSGTVTVNASNADVSPNLDIEAQLINSGGTAVDTDNPASARVSRDSASGLDASASGTALPSGQYYVRIDGVGRGTALNGYTDYGSVGAYTLQVTGCGGVVVTPPSAPRNLAGDYIGGGTVKLSWTPPSSNGGGAITGYRVYADGVALTPDLSSSATGASIANVPTGEHLFEVLAKNSAGDGPRANVTVDASEGPPETLPGKTRIGKATKGKRGGDLTAKISWQPPSASADPAINGYQVIAYRENRKGKFVKFSTSPVQPAGARSIAFTTSTKARLKFAVRARNAVGFGRLSAKSNAVGRGRSATVWSVPPVGGRARSRPGHRR